jgi:hypothetical protein
MGLGNKLNQVPKQAIFIKVDKITVKKITFKVIKIRNKS